MKKNKEVIETILNNPRANFRMSSGKEVQELLAELSPLVAASVQAEKVDHGNISVKVTVYYTLHVSDLDDSDQEG